MMLLALAVFTFEPNVGQAPGDADFIARGPKYTIVLRADRAGFRASGAEIHLRFVGANASAPKEAPAPQPGASHYLRGRDPARWRTGVSRYARVRYRSVYPGIDVEYYDRQGRLEYDLVVAPGADLSVVRLRFEKAKVKLAPDGDLVVDSGAVQWRQHRPRAYQGNRQIACTYAVRTGGEITLRAGPYDSTLPLVVDPVLSLGYSTYLGGNAPGFTGAPAAITVDRAGYAYVAGTTASPDPSRQDLDAFVAKLTPQGDALVYLTLLGGLELDYGSSIAIDTDGNAYVAGRTFSGDFPVTPGTLPAVMPQPIGTTLLW
jgi:hypothetical protein